MKPKAGTQSPQAEPITSPTMTGVEDAWSCPIETQWVDENIFLSPMHQSEAKIKDEGASLADSTTSPATSHAKDTQPSPTEISLADHITVPLAKLNTETKKDLPTAQATSPVENTETQKNVPIAQATSPAKVTKT